MFLDFEPSGINDTYLRLTRRGLSCIVAPAGVWNGLLRVNCIVAGSSSRDEPYMVFRCQDVGWDDGRFSRRGHAAPVLTSPAMARLMQERGLVTDQEAQQLLINLPSSAVDTANDETLMLRAALMGCSFSPVYGEPASMDAPPPVVGYVMRTLADSSAFILEACNGLPVLDEAARAALKRQLSAAF